MLKTVLGRARLQPCHSGFGKKRALASEGYAWKAEQKLFGHFRPGDQPLRHHRHRHRCSWLWVHRSCAAFRLEGDRARKNSHTSPRSALGRASPEFSLASARVDCCSDLNPAPCARLRGGNRSRSMVSACTSLNGIRAKAGRDVIRETHSLRECKRRNKPGRARRCFSPPLRRQGAGLGSAPRDPFLLCRRRLFPRALRLQRGASGPSATADLARSRIPGQKISLRALPLQLLGLRVRRAQLSPWTKFRGPRSCHPFAGRPNERSSTTTRWSR